MLNNLMKDEGGFAHNEQSIRVVEKLENDGKGLNLTYEVKDGTIMRAICVTSSVCVKRVR